MRHFTDPMTILDAKAANGIGTPILVRDWRHLVLALDTAGNANLVVKFQGSIQKDKPDFSAAQSATNQWDYVAVKDLEDASSIDGDTGITLAGTDDHRHFEINVNHLAWVNAIVSARAAGNATLKAVCSDD